MNSNTSFKRASLHGLLFALTYFAVMALVLDRLNIFEFNKDEGLNLIKTSLLSKGFELYSEIWSDQPPLFTHLLGTVFSIFGASVEVGRLTVLTTASMLLGTVFVLMQHCAGSLAAGLSVVLIALLPHFPILSISILIGIPSLFFATISLLSIVRWHTNRSLAAVVLAGVALGLSLFTKFFTGILIPIFLIGLWLGGGNRGESCRTLLTFAATLLATVTTLSVIWLDWEQLSQLYSPHALARTVSDFDKHSSAIIFEQSGALIVLAIIGLITAIRQRNWLILYPAAWALLAIAVLSMHQPVWAHQRLLVTIPLAMLGAITLAEGWRILISDHALGNRRRIIRIFVAIVSVALLVFVVQTGRTRYYEWKSVNSIRLSKDTVDYVSFLKVINTYASESNWLVTDRLMLAFRADIPVPPEIAVISKKRRKTGYLTDLNMLEALQKYDPEMVFLTRFKWPDLQPYIDEHYQPIRLDEKHTLFVASRIKILSD